MPVESQSPDTLFYNGKIVTVDDAFSIVDALAIRGDRIVALGEAARQSAGPETKMIDLGGATVVPGLIDSHLHASFSGLVIGGVDLLHARSIDDVLAAISERAKVTPKGEWIRAHPCWMEGMLKEKRLPTPAELDSVTPDHPVYLQRTGFTVVLNSYARNLLGITNDIEPSLGTAIIKHPQTGEPLVFIGHQPSMPSLETVATKDDWLAAVKAITHHLNKFGVTGYTEPLVPAAAMQAYQTLWARGELTARVNMMLSHHDGTGYESMGIPNFLDEIGLFSGFGDSMLRFNAIGQVGMRDGVPGALMRDAYAWMDGGLENYHGVDSLAGGKEAFENGAVRAAKNDWRLALNSCGDAQLDWALDLFERVQQEAPGEDRRHVAVHPFLLHDDQLKRIKELNLVVQMELHAYMFAPSLEKYWGRERAEAAFSARTLMDNGVVVGLGSDGPVLPDNPFIGMSYFITRETPLGVLGAEQAITREQALRGYTINGAYITCEEKVKGSLEVGKLADLAILSDDILTCDESAIKDITATLTMIGGKIVHDTRVQPA